MKALNAYFKPQSNNAFEIYNFHQAKQKDGESIDTFTTRLKQLAATCDFQNTDKEVANQIIFACKRQTLRRRALREDSSLDALLKAARAYKISD